MKVQLTATTILDYVTEVWGYKNFKQIDAVQTRQLKYFWGCIKLYTIAAINGDMGWTSSCVKGKTNIIRFWNRLMCMNNNHLPKIIFNWDYSCRCNTWSSNIKSIFDDIDFQNKFYSKSQVSMNSCWALLHELQCKQWLDEITRLPAR